MSGLRLFLLGAPYLERNGTALQIGSRKALAALAYLAVTGQSHGRQGLAALLWPEVDRSDALLELGRSLDMLDQVLGSKALDVDQETVAIVRRAGEPGAMWLDVDHFGRLLKTRGTHGHPLDEVCPECIPLLSEAVDLYRGDFMVGHDLPESTAYEGWRLFQQDMLRREVIRALDHLVRGHGARGEFETAIAYARRVLQMDPWRESAHRQLMSLYAWRGDLAAAQDQYQECVRLLEQELGQSPEKATDDLHRSIQAGQALPPLSWAKTAIPVPGVGSPVRPAPFVNREGELVEIERLLLGDPRGERGQPPCRLLTLLGPDGVGKTRLAMQVVERMRGAYADGVYAVTLSDLAPAEHTPGVDPEGLLVAAIAESMGYSFQGGLSSGDKGLKDQLFDYMRAKNVLLVLDGLDYFAAAAGPVADIQGAASRMTLLVTAREPLGLDGESVWNVGGLGGAHDGAVLVDDSAVKLLLESVHRLTASYPLSEADRRAAVRICQLVDGMPLGLELASAWSRAMSLTQIAAEIEHTLASLSALSDVPPGYRTLRAVLERSWLLLSEDEQGTVARLSVFRGGFDRDAAQRVAGASPFLLLSLARAALVRPQLKSFLPQAERYELHELVRQFVVDKLHERPAAEPEARDAHCAYYATFLHERGERLRGAEQRAAGDEIAAEIDNVRAAWHWAVSGRRMAEIEQSLEALYLFYYARGWMQEGQAVFESAAAALQGERPSTHGDEYVVGLLLARQARFAHRLGQHERARDLLFESRAALDRFEGAGRDGNSANIVPRQERAFGLFALSAVLRALGEAARAREHLQEGLALYRECQDLGGMAMTLKLLGIVYGSLGETAEAQQRLQEALSLYQQIVDPYGTASTLNDLSIVAARQGKLPEAQRLNRECLGIRRQIGDRWGVGTSLNNLGYMAYLSGSYVEAVEHLSEGLAIQREIGDRYHIANCLSNLGAAAHALGEREQALAHLYEGLEIAYEIAARPLVLEISAEIGAVLAEDDAQEGEQAAELLTFVHDHPQTDKWTVERTEQSLTQLASLLAPEVWGAAQERGQSGTLDAVVDSLLRHGRAA